MCKTRYLHPMKQIRIFPIIIAFVLLRCRTSEQIPSTFMAFTGARIIDGSGAPPVENGVLLVENGRVSAVGSRNAVAIPEGAAVTDLSGKTIIPGIINAHGHVGNAKGIEG